MKLNIDLFVLIHFLCVSFEAGCENCDCISAKLC